MSVEPPTFMTWLGPAPPVTEIDTDLLSSQHEYSDVFALQFNEDPCQTMKTFLAQRKELSDQFTIGYYLFHCPGLNPAMLYRFFFENDMENAPLLLYFYFSAASLEFMDLADAIRMLIPRIALPLDEQKVSAIFYAFARAYLTANEWCNISDDFVMRTAVACVMCSLQGLEESKFMHILSKVPVPEIFKKHIYEKISLKPIPIFLTFTSTIHKPEFTKCGMLKKMRGSFSGKTKRFFVVDEDGLKYYKDEKKKQVLGEVDISCVLAELIRAASKKETDHILIRRLDGNAMAGAKIGKDGAKKKCSHKKYEVFAEDTKSLESWITLFNTYSFGTMLLKLATAPPVVA